MTQGRLNPSQSLFASGSPPRTVKACEGGTHTDPAPEDDKPGYVKRADELVPCIVELMAIRTDPNQRPNTDVVRTARRALPPTRPTSASGVATLALAGKCSRAMLRSGRVPPQTCLLAMTHRATCPHRHTSSAAGCPKPFPRRGPSCCWAISAHRCSSVPTHLFVTTFRATTLYRNIVRAPLPLPHRLLEVTRRAVDEYQHAIRARRVVPTCLLATSPYELLDAVHGIASNGGGGGQRRWRGRNVCGHRRW